MFEQRNGGWSYSWTGIVGVVIIIIAVVQIFKVNPPGKIGPAESRPFWTEGQIFKGAAEVPENGFLSYPLNLNRRSTLSAFFTTGRNDRRLTGTVIKADDFNMWKSGEEVQTVLTTGKVPRGTINRVLEPGNYLFLLDNRSSGDLTKLSQLEISVE